MLNERLELSEALLVAGKIIACYPLTRKVSDSYQGAIAAALGSYPASVVRRAHLVPGGIPAEYRDLPSVAHVIKWCEENTEPLYRRAERQERAREQLNDRVERERNRSSRGKAMAKAWLDRSDPVAAQLSGEAPYASELEPDGPHYTYKEFLDWAKANGKPPRPIGRFEELRPARKSSEKEIADARAELVAQVGQEAFDALPDARSG